MNLNLAASAAFITAVGARVLDDIDAHGVAAYPHECCGALIAVQGVVVEAFALPNTTRGEPRRRFTIAPEDYRAAEVRARGRRGTLAGFYHSHPDAPARPSAHDLEHAWPNLIYLIVAVDGGAPGEVTVWRLREDRSCFDEGALQCHTGF